MEIEVLVINTPFEYNKSDYQPKKLMRRSFFVSRGGAKV